MQSRLDRLRTGLIGTPWSKSHVLHLRWYNPLHQHMLGLTGWKAAQGKDFGSMVTNKLKSKECTLTTKAARAFWAAVGSALSVDQERWSFLSVQHWWDHSWSAALSSGLLNARDIQTYRDKSSTGPQDNWGTGASFIRGEAGTAGIG